MPQNELFNPFGEKVTAPSQRSVTVARVGTALFWLMVLALVMARVFYQT